MIRVLLIEENEVDARLIRTMLSENKYEAYDISFAMNIADAIKYLKNEQDTDVILSNIALSDSRGLQTFRKLRRVAANLPVIFFTHSKNESLAIAALQKGAQDYLFEGHFDSETLVRSIRYSIARKEFQMDVDRMKNETQKLRQKATLLRKERKQLMVLNAAKDDFITLASHQLRTPATGVKQYIGMLLEGYAGTLTDKQLSMLNVAYDSNERQLLIVNDLLKVAQVDSGNLTLNRSKVDIVELMQEVIKGIRIKFDERQQTLTFKSNTSPIIADIDPACFRMVLENIIDNASKYSNHGKRVNVTVIKKSNTITIKVKDEGVGIAKDDIAKVFLKFMRVSNPLSVRVGGSGLGMYWAKKIINLHGAEIKVDSKLGKGTVFTIVLDAV